MPSVTSPNGAKPLASSRALSLKLMNTCVVRVFGPASGERDVAALVALLDRIVLEAGCFARRLLNARRSR